jgi:hypothetical protein
VPATRIREELLPAMTCVRQADNQSHDTVNWIRKSIQRVQCALLSQEFPKLTAHFYGKCAGSICRSLTQSSKLRRRLAREFLENTIELRQRLETDGEGDFADPKIRILQEITRFADAYAGDVIDKVDPGHFFELLAQVIAADVAKLRDFR